MNRTSKIDEMDLLLYSAMSYVENKEIEEYEKAADIPVILSEKDKKRILRRIKRAGAYREKHKVYHPVWEMLKRVAVVVLVILSLGFAGAVSIEAVRYTIWETIVEWYENSIYFAYENRDELVVPDKILEYKEPVLDGWLRYETGKTEYKMVIEYEREGYLITYSQNLLDDYDVLLSNHNTEMKDIEVNGYQGTMVMFTTEGVTDTTIIWHDSEYVYKMSSNLGYEELLKVAESIM